MASGAPKNVLMISMDDAVAFWKIKQVFGVTLQTPNLDRICAQSTAFQAAYCQVPVCTPSRASFMSGLSPHHTGITRQGMHHFKENLPAEKIWPYTLRQNGYYCSSGGKVVKNYKPLPDEVHETIYDDAPKAFRVDWRIPPKISESYGGLGGGWAAKDPKHDQRFYDYQSASSFVEFLNGYDGKQPFYREVGFYGPHGPWITPARFKQMYPFQQFKMPKAWAKGFAPHAFVDQEAPPNFNLSKHRVWKQTIRNYFSALTHVDHHLGRVWDALKSSEHADNTLVVIVADHGLHMGDRHRFRKHTLYEQVANVPLIIHDPEQPVGQVVSDPVALLDVGPTVMDYLGLPPIDGSVGRSLVPQMNWARAPERAVPTFYQQGAAIRKGRYRFIRHGDGSTELFDLAKDWWQMVELGQTHEAYKPMAEAFEACVSDYGMTL